MNALRIIVPGRPQGKGRVRFTRAGRTYTPAKTVAYEGLIALAGQDAMQGRDMIEGPVYLTVTATFDIPKSRTKQIASAMTGGIAWHTSKPDSDNIAKAVGDGLNGIVWKDDSQLSMVKCLKIYGDQPHLEIVVEELA